MNTETNLRKSDSNTDKPCERCAVAPPSDIFETKEELIIVADMPGVPEEALSVAFQNGQLTLEGRPAGQADGPDAWEYRRSFVIPPGIDAEKIAAKLERGVLRVTLPKAASLRPRQIQVTSA